MGMHVTDKELQKLIKTIRYKGCKNCKHQIAPCPFCGGEARLRKHQKLEQTWYVQCTWCGIRTPNFVQAAYESWKTTMNYPVRLWNRRVEDGNDD